MDTKYFTLFICNIIILFFAYLSTIITNFRNLDINDLKNKTISQDDFNLNLRLIYVFFLVFSIPFIIILIISCIEFSSLDLSDPENKNKVYINSINIATLLCFILLFISITTYSFMNSYISYFLCALILTGNITNIILYLKN